MVITLLGLMRLCDLSFGAVSALALALVLGMSVDYIIHLAHAFKNARLSPQRFHKSRATVLARATSIGSAAATTLAAVSPLLFAQLLPLRERMRAVRRACTAAGGCHAAGNRLAGACGLA